MKTRFLPVIALLALATIANAGQIGPYLWTYNATPVDAPVTAINPPAGATVIDTTTGVSYRKISAVGSNASYAVDPVEVVTAASPLTGATITANVLKSDAIEYLTPAGTIAALTYTFPSNANSRIGQRLTLLSTQIVTALTVSAAGQTVTATTALAANTPATFIKVAASTWIRISNTPTTVGIAITSPVITTGLTASGSTANDFSASTGTFLTSSGANTLSGAVTVADATTPSITLASGKTNTGFLTISGKTSGGLKLLPVDAAGQTVTLSLAAQTSGAATLTINDLAGVAGSVLTSTLTTNTPSAANSVWGASNGLVFEGATADAFETTLTLTDPTVDRTITLPDATGFVQAENVYAHSATGSITANELYGGVLTNTGASGAVVYTLPAPVVGMHFRVYLTVAQDVDINPADSTQILVLTNATGDAISSAATIGNAIELIALSTTTWGAFFTSGVWTDSN